MCGASTRVPADVVSFLRGNRELVFDHLGGNQRDRPSLELLSTLDIELAYCTDDVTAEVDHCRDHRRCRRRADRHRYRNDRRVQSTRTQSRCGSPYAAGR